MDDYTIEHLPEGELVRYLDGETAGGDRARIAAHLLACSECHASLEDLHAAREELGDMLAATLPPIDTDRRAFALARIEAAAQRKDARTTVGRRGRYSALRAAAVTLVVMGAALSTSPVRAWVIDTWSSVTDVATDTQNEASPLPSVRLNNASVGFVPVGNVLQIDVANHQADGALVLGVTEGPSVIANAVGAAGIVDLVVLPTGMQIRNEAMDRADYGVQVPRSVSEVRVSVAGAPAATYEMNQLESTWVSVVQLQEDQ